MISMIMGANGIGICKLNELLKLVKEYVASCSVRQQLCISASASFPMYLISYTTSEGVMVGRQKMKPRIEFKRPSTNIQVQ